MNQDTGHSMTGNQGPQERAIVIGLVTERDHQAEERAAASLDELTELVRACGAQVEGRAVQFRDKPDPATYIGRGKLEEICEQARQLEANLLVFDEELSGSQTRNIQEQSGLKILDRTAVILDIFARRARSREGKLQVELAQYEYRLSRVFLINEAMSRLGGGIGTRGPGESQLETDRRHIRLRISKLKRELEELGQRRSRVRDKRSEAGAAIVAVVGYTNAGKTSLINALAGTDLVAMDQVFATLDPAARRMELPDGQVLILVDTVGFIRKLPHQLVEAFKSTLEELRDADLILQVTDLADPDAVAEAEVVEQQLKRLDAQEKPRVQVLNKIDLLDKPVPSYLLTPDRHGVDRVVIPLSVKTGQGLPELREALAQLAGHQMLNYRLTLPFRESALLAYIKNHAARLEEQYTESGAVLSFGLDRRLSGPVERYLQGAVAADSEETTDSIQGKKD
ncbi:GTPase HflX [Oscillospiraceae bacterium HV4-5-C5C]|nr:GTPase HflX [Oscillospiraceae bacterium HV4-5-C5C]